MAREEVACSNSNSSSDDRECPTKKRKLTMSYENRSKEGEQSPTKNQMLITSVDQPPQSDDHQSSTDDDDDDEDDDDDGDDDDDEDDDEEEEDTHTGDEDADDVDDDDDDDVEEEDELTLEEKRLPRDYVFEDDDSLVNMNEEITKRYEKYENGPPIFHSDPEPLDISEACFNIIDPEKETDDWDLKFFYDFMDMCRRKKNIQTFDHPGNPRIGGMGHTVGKYANKEHNRVLAQTAIDEYRKCNPNANLTLKKVKCVNQTLYYCSIYYLTFKAKDNNTNKTNTYQAALWNDLDRYELGLLRDASNDKVLAILKVKEQPSQVLDHPDEAPEPSFEEDPSNKAEVCDLPENEDGLITEEEIAEPPAQLNQSEAANVTAVPSASQDDAPKKSYASILKAMNTNPSPVLAKTPASNIKAKLPSGDLQAVGSIKAGPAI